MVLLLKTIKEFTEEGRKLSKQQVIILITYEGNIFFFINCHTCNSKLEGKKQIKIIQGPIRIHLELIAKIVQIHVKLSHGSHISQSMKFSFG